MTLFVSDLTEYASWLDPLSGAWNLTVLQLHFNHPSMYDEIYSRKWDKDPSMYNLLGGDGATITTLKYQDNKIRKHVLLPFFAKTSVASMQWLIQENVGYVSQVSCS